MAPCEAMLAHAGICESKGSTFGEMRSAGFEVSTGGGFLKEKLISAGDTCSTMKLLNSKSCPVGDATVVCCACAERNATAPMNIMDNSDCIFMGVVRFNLSQNGDFWNGLEKLLKGGKISSE